MAARHAPQPTPTTNHVNGSGAGGGGGGSRDGVVVRVRPASTALASNGAAPPPPRSTGLTVLLSAPYAFPHASRYAEVLAAFGIDTLRVGPGVERCAPPFPLGVFPFLSLSPPPQAGGGPAAE